MIVYDNDGFMVELGWLVGWIEIKIVIDVWVERLMIW